MFNKFRFWLAGKIVPKGSLIINIDPNAHMDLFDAENIDASNSIEYQPEGDKNYEIIITADLSRIEVSGPDG